MTHTRIFDLADYLTSDADIAAYHLEMTDTGDACDCPACEPRCMKDGKPCFILCAKCSGKAESDEVGDLKSVTRRI
jgi:hypothetical protein